MNVAATLTVLFILNVLLFAAGFVLGIHIESRKEDKKKNGTGDIE